jgi:hypothetical protein
VAVLVNDASRKAAAADREQQHREHDQPHQRLPSAPVVVLMPVAALFDDAARQAETGEGKEKSERQSFHKGLLFCSKEATAPKGKLRR